MSDVAPELPEGEALEEEPLFCVGLPYSEWEEKGYTRDAGEGRFACLILLVILLVSGVVLGMKWAAEQFEVPTTLFFFSDDGHVGDLVMLATLGALLAVHVTTLHVRASRGGAAVFPDRVEVAHPSTLGLLVGGGRVTSCPWETVSGYREPNATFVQLYCLGSWRWPYLGYALPTPTESERVTLLLHLDGHGLPRFG